MYKVIADFPLTTNLHFKKFSKQPSTLVALAYEAGGNCPPRFVRERSEIVRTKLQNHRPAKLF